MKLTRIVEVALNGDAMDVDPAVRRALYALTNELDEQSVDWDRRINGLSNKIDNGFVELGQELRKEVASEVRSTRRLLITLTGTFVTTIAVGLANILFTL